MFGFFRRRFGRKTPPAPPVPVPVPQPAERGRPGMSYAPLIASAQPVRGYELGEYRAVLLGDVESAGMVRYAHILAVYDPTGEPCLYVAAEVNGLAASLGGGSHFLGVFPGDAHLNLGASDEWADRERFARKALEVAKQHLGIA